MEGKYRIVPDFYMPDSCMKMHPDTAYRLGIKHEKYRILKFGTSSCLIQIMISSSMSPKKLQISRNVLHVMHIPLTPYYEIRNKDPELLLGPYVGLLTAPTEEVLREMLPSLTSYLADYETIGGAVLAFSFDGVERESSKIRGYLFNPQTKQWDEGIYGYPASLFSTVEVSLTRKWRQFQSLLHHFHSVMGNHVFNYPVFSKWEMYESLHPLPGLNQFLPETRLYQHPMDIYQMAKKYKKVYIKPIFGRLGLGVMKMIKTGLSVEIRYRKDHQNIKMSFANPDECFRFFDHVLIPGQYLLQVSVDLISYKKRMIDFRVMLVKDQLGKWRDIGFFARYGPENSVVTNITAGGSTECGEAALKRVLRLKDDKVKEIREKVRGLSIKSAKAIEAEGIHCGNLGVDIGIDKNDKLWLLEINNQNPDPYIALVAGKSDIFYRARRFNMLYAKKLAGFQ